MMHATLERSVPWSRLANGGNQQRMFRVRTGRESSPATWILATSWSFQCRAGKWTFLSTHHSGPGHTTLSVIVIKTLSSHPWALPP